MFKYSVLIGTSVCAFLAVANQAAFAGSPITVFTDQTQMIALAQDPGTVVVGNPSIADISVDGRRVFLHGRSYGNTNITILDSQGNQMANFDVSVTHNANNEVAIFAATSSPADHASRFSYACDPLCQKTVIAGDNIQFFGEMAGQNSQKNSLALGSTTAPVAAPNSGGGAPPQ